MKSTLVSLIPLIKSIPLTIILIRTVKTSDENLSNLIMTVHSDNSTQCCKIILMLHLSKSIFTHLLLLVINADLEVTNYLNKCCSKTMIDFMKHLFPSQVKFDFMEFYPFFSRRLLL